MQFLLNYIERSCPFLRSNLRIDIFIQQGYLNGLIIRNNLNQITSKIAICYRHYQTLHPDLIPKRN